MRMGAGEIFRGVERCFGWDYFCCFYIFFSMVKGVGIKSWLELVGGR